MAGIVTAGTPRGVLTACTIGNAVSVTPAVHAVFGLFLLPLSQAFGWQRASISVVLGILAIGSAILYPLIGRHIDRHGARRTLIVGHVGLALSIAALALTDGSLVQFYANFGAITLFGAMAGTPIFQKVIADWFDDNRGTALGVSGGVGCGVGSVLLPVIAAMLMATQGWRVAYLGIAAAMLAIGLPTLLMLLRDRHVDSDVGAVAILDGLTLAQAAHTGRFWLVLCAIAVGAGCTTAIFSHVVPILQDRGFSIAIGTAVVGVFALVTSAWQVATGRILDSVETPRVVVPMYGLAIAGLALIELGRSTLLLMLGGAMLGIALGSQFGALPYFIARYFGLRAFGAIIGAMYSAVMAAQGLTPILLDAAFDAQGNYRDALVVVGFCLALCAALLLALPRFDAATSPALPALHHA